MAFSDAPQCTAHTQRGDRCPHPAIRGATVCRKHGGNAPAVRRKAAIRALVTDWQVELPEVDPADQLRRLISVTAWRQAQLHWLINTVSTTDPDDTDGPNDWRRVLASYVGVKTAEDGSKEEYLRVLVREERAERELCAKLCSQAIAAGLDERRVRFMEAQAMALVGLFDAFAEGLGLTDEQAERVPEVAERVLRAVPAIGAGDVPGELAG